MIQNIEIERLHQHPHNPRKELGDLTELANSIRANGVFQNLTVVPFDPEHTGGGITIPDEYVVVIGHRRLAASKLAGLTELPCVISDMDMHDQVATMLLENMQRSDLTILEQADGFQMMMNLGESISTISEKTGFAEPTVRHRLKLNELDRAKLEKAAMRGGRIEDYIALEQIRDAETRNKLLENIGTANFKWAVENAISEQEKPERKQAILSGLEQFAKLIDRKDALGMNYVTGFWNFKGTVTPPARPPWQISAYRTRARPGAGSLSRWTEHGTARLRRSNWLRSRACPWRSTGIPCSSPVIARADGANTSETRYPWAPGRALETPSWRR